MTRLTNSSASAVAHINRIGTAVPDHDIHQAFIGWAEGRLGDPRERRLFARMAERAGIAHRWSVLPPSPASPVDEGGFYAGGHMPGTAARMRLYAEEAPRVALAAVAKLGGLGEVTHLVVASCTGFVAPGIDQLIAEALHLPGSVERTLIGFMGCYAAVAALRTARHIVRSEAHARVLVVAVELSTLHLQPDDRIEPLLSQLLFGDGAAAALVTAEATGFAIEHPFSATLPETAPLIGWTIGDTGFAMHLSGEVPGRIGQALAGGMLADVIGDEPVDAWAVHAGGRSILDAVEHGLGLAPDVLAASRAVLHDHGNMSSATLMFVLERLMAQPGAVHGLAIAFGPGLAAEGFRFGRAG